MMKGLVKVVELPEFNIYVMHVKLYLCTVYKAGQSVLYYTCAYLGSGAGGQGGGGMNPPTFSKEGPCPPT